MENMKEMATKTTAERNDQIGKANAREKMAKSGNDSALQGI
jgi:hypothetical protein